VFIGEKKAHGHLGVETVKRWWKEEDKYPGQNILRENVHKKKGKGRPRDS